MKDVVAEVISAARTARRTTTADGDLAEAIVRMIIMQPLEPGTPLRENEIAVRFGVSRPTARAALRSAATTGFVEITAFRGAHVRQVGPRDFGILIDLVEMNYALAASEAARYRNETDVKRLRKILAQFDGNIDETSDPDPRIQLSFHFGSLVAAAAHSHFIHDALTHCGRLVLWQQRLRFADVVWFEQQSLEFHRLLVWAIAHENPDAAADAARAIVRLTRTALEKSKAL